MYSSLMIHFATWYLVAWYFTWAVGLRTSPYLYYKSLLTFIKVAVLEVSVANSVTLSPNLVSFQTLLTTLFQKPRVPNVVTFSGGTGDFWRLWHESTYCSYSSQQAACAVVGPSHPKASQTAQSVHNSPTKLQSEQEMFNPQSPDCKWIARAKSCRWLIPAYSQGRM